MLKLRESLKLAPKFRGNPLTIWDSNENTGARSRSVYSHCVLCVCGTVLARPVVHRGRSMAWQAGVKRADKQELENLFLKVFQAL